jgi:hypothetical protein
MNPAVSPQRSITLASKISPPVTRSCLHPFPRAWFQVSYSSFMSKLTAENVNFFTT